MSLEKIKILDLSLDSHQQPQNEEGGDAGEEGGTGVSSLSVEKIGDYLRAALIKEIREGEKNFASVPLSDDPNLLLKEQSSVQGLEHENTQKHPYLIKSQQFSGDDPDLNANLIDNPEAQKKYPELVLANALRMGKRKLPTMRR